MTPQELKNSILQLAIQGKLVEQRKEEGTAEELYQQIQAEKQNLIKAGKMKKGKLLPQITDDDIPFDIPANWKWVRISELGEVIGGGTPKTENANFWDDAEIPWLTPADMKFIIGKYAERGERNISAIGLKKSSAQLMPKGTVLYSSRAPIGYIAIAANDISTNQGFKSLVPTLMDINEYMYFCLTSRTSDIVSRASGTTFKEISGTDFGLTIVPLPPLAEQKRIVAKIEELLPYIDRYEKAWSKLEDFNKRFPTDMRKSILHTAIQGKLVEQRPYEGTGEELYRQIQAEKRRLVKVGIIKNGKPLPEIAEDEKPFDIPENWIWVKLGELLTYQNGYAYKSSEMNKSCKGYPVIKSGNLMTLKVVLKEKNDYIDIPTEKMLESQINKGDMLMCLSSQSNNPEPLGKTAIFEFAAPALLNQRVLKMKPLNPLITDYLYFTINSEYFHFTVSHQGGGSAQANLKLEHVLNMLIPLPPLAEQKRIAAKLEEILPLCERLKR